jgi:hypothetical protein
MNDTSKQTAAVTDDLLFEHCAALPNGHHTSAEAFHRLEQAVGGELARFLVVALSDRDDDRPDVAA